MASSPKEWLVRKAKRHYIGPFDTETVKKLIREAEIGAYDEIARSEQPWGYVKDCPPFSQYVEEEKTVNLSPEEVTSVTQPGVKGYTAPPVSSKPLPPKLKEVPLSPKPIEMVPLYKRRWVPWIGGSSLLVIFMVVIWRILPHPEIKKPFESELSTVSVNQKEKTPPLEEISDVFQKVNVLFYQAKIEESAGEYKKAHELYQKALSLNPADVRAKVRLLALDLQENKNSDQLRTQFLTLLSDRQLPKTWVVEIENYLGLLDLKENNFSKALPHFQVAIQQDSNFSPAHFNLGYCYFYEKQYYNARKYFERAVQLQPNLPLIYLYLGRTLQKLNKNEEAIREYMNANRINPNLPQSYLYLSVIYFKLNQRKMAFSFLEKMVQRDPDYEKNYYKDFRYTQEELSYRFIIQAYSFMLKEKGISPTLMAGLGLLYYLDGNIAQGKEWIQKAIQTNKEDATVHMIYGYVLQKEGDLEGALSELKTSLRYRYENSLTHVFMADIHIRLGYYQEAIEHCRKVFSFDPFYGAAYHLLGVALIHLDRVGEAQEAFNKTLEYDPNYLPSKKMLLQYSK
ncbi:MAG: hypothetical protein A2Z91_07390 [Deltaproteobacteria bacterium GWA2_38_16]|nr:MAG: hypothetical protein A2Z91_07390 [Deltaproteobacteria bacterium GWA2_38_16]OGQ02731.1 MAG: hypothetical protein A3D19_00725 [Deltaproteobacteria bacterium RIFCSPHIGHO2_02_FULL_38_15]OGQ31871.1 MAG: hypothetical protein A3A72_02345 [Deltaproteobacteria bacterium RIFCSPLOWO2_01_FULL_38_9]OGQ59085.1 MAG: hypothetical protein A3G92_06180 [Deltaproteobacteria bacterium RIFCSPLOWO2_12_FULL_38_8]HBQ20591.1 hypothetical protein [Deltaproteobacteria bacterium]